MTSIKGKVIEQTTEGADVHLKRLAKNTSELVNTTIENQTISELS